MPKIKIKKGDQVKVITGVSKGSQGKILKVFPSKNRIIVSGVNIAKKHLKPSAQKPQGGVIHIELPIHISNVSLIDPQLGCITRVKYIIKEGKKIRISKKSGREI